jgi:serine/threonine-protein kinase HipA
MAVRESKLIAFANIGAQWAPCGQLALTEEGSNLIASSFAYGLNYLKRSDALEVDPVSLSIADRSSVAGKYLLPVNALHFFGGIRDAAPDSWGRRVIEARFKAPPNSLAESEYLLHAGSERVGALDIRSSRTDLQTSGAWCGNGGSTSTSSGSTRPRWTRPPQSFATSMTYRPRNCASFCREKPDQTAIGAVNGS